MEQTIEILKAAVSQSYSEDIDKIPFWDRKADVFEGVSDSTTVIRRDVAFVSGAEKSIRRVFVRLQHSEDYRNVGWVVDGDLDACMICGVEFGLFERRTHCRLCGDLVCKECCSAAVVLKEFRDAGYVQSCNMCYYGQDESAVKFPQSTRVIHQKIQRIQRQRSNPLPSTTSQVSNEQQKDLIRSQFQQQETAAKIRSDQMHSPTLESARAHAAQLAVDEDEEDDEEGLRPGHEQQSASQSRRPSLGPSRHIERQKAIPDLSHISDVIPTETKTDLQGKEEDETNFTFGEQQQQHERHQQAQNGDPNSIVINEKNKFILPSFLPFTPQTVLKLRDGDGNDIFINVSKSDALQDDSFVVSKNSPLRSDDKQGNASSIYDVCIAAVTKLNDEKVFEMVISHLNANQCTSILPQHCFPTTKGDYKGDHVPDFSGEIVLFDSQICDTVKPESHAQSTEVDDANQKKSDTVLPNTQVSLTNEETVVETGDRNKAEDESITGEDLFTATPFAVLKVRDASQQKVFVNVCVNDSALRSRDIVIGQDCPRPVQDKKGFTSLTYDVCVHSDLLIDSLEQEKYFPLILSHLNRMTGRKLSEDYTLLKLKTKFKGDHRPFFLLSNKLALEEEGEVFDGSQPPPRHSGSLKRQEGSFVKSFKKRFCLLQSGVLLFYKDSEDFSSKKQELDMIDLKATSFIVSDTVAVSKSSGGLNLVLQDKNDQKFEVVLQLSHETERQDWAHHIKQHLAYVAYKSAYLLS